MNWQEQYDPKLVSLVREVDQQIAPRIAELDEQIMDNQQKVLDSFRSHNVSEAHLNGSRGYGDDDQGRDVLEEIYAEVLGGEAALVRPQFVSGTHTIGVAILGLLRPGDEVLYVTGEPYDTLQQVLGMAGNGIGSAKEYGINADYVDLTADGQFDGDAVAQRIRPETKLIVIQRSRGYGTRDSFTVGKIEAMIKRIRAVAPDIWIFIDNAYGEFSETREPLHVGADLMAGSLIKNAGGGIAKTGGYIVGKRELVERVSYRFTVPGIGDSEGATGESLFDMFEGFFLAPSVTGNAIKGAVFEAALLEKLGLAVSPKWDAPRTDLIQTVNFGNPDDMVAFAKAVQAYSPVDSFVTPVPSEMPGYTDQVIMAAGNFVSGSTIEFSADGPLRAPYTLYMQGGLTYAHVRLGVIGAAQATFFNK